MQITFASIVAAGLVLTPMVSAFSITNCVNGRYTNFGQAGNKKCQAFNTNDKVSYDSNKGLKLTVWSGTNCQGQSWSTTAQNTCLNIPFQGQSVKAA
jgi:hypothetical protein